MPEFTIEAANLRRSLSTMVGFTSPDAYVPPILQCVSIRPFDGAVDFAATDRYVMAWESAKVAGEAFPLRLHRNIVRRILTLLPKGTKRDPLTGMVTFVRDEGDRVTLRFIGDFDTTISFELEEPDGFPDYRKLMAEHRPPEDGAALPPVHFDPRKVVRVCKALADRGGMDPVRISFRGPTAPVFLTQGDFVSLIMPVAVPDGER